MDRLLSQLFQRKPVGVAIKSYFPLHSKESKNSEVLESFKEMIINVPIQNPLLIIEALKKLYNIKTKFILPKRGNKAQILNDIAL
nr:hypothetical protein [Rickettsia endosymbiont of Ceutorhynchus assimilis]